MVFLYFLAFGFFRFIHKGNVSSYVVNDGSLSDNSSFTAFALRQEKIVNATGSGELHLYAKEGTKVSYGETIYTLDETGSLRALMDNISSDQSGLSDSDLKEISDSISAYKKTFDPSAFSRVYDFKTTIEGDIVDILSLSAIKSGKIDTADLKVEKATVPGIIQYSYDGYENVTVDSFTSEMVENHKLKKISTRALKNVQAGDPVYKLITDEHWNLIMEVDDSFISKLKDSSSIQIRFVDDSQFAWVNYKIVTRDDKKYLVLSIPNSVIRYGSQRFVKIEVRTSGVFGLKVPKTAVVKKDCYIIPKDYLTKGGSKGNDGFNAENGSSVDFTEPDIVFSDDKYYYVNTKEYTAGTRLIKPGSTESYTIGPTGELDGVYNINKGYPIFENITILDENDEYCIISSTSKYGVKKYDYIALDGKLVSEDEVLH